VVKKKKREGRKSRFYLHLRGEKKKQLDQEMDELTGKEGGAHGRMHAPSRAQKGITHYRKENMATASPVSVITIFGKKGAD